MPDEIAAATDGKSWVKVTITADETISDAIAAFLSEQTGGAEQIPEGKQEKVVCYLKNDPNAKEGLRLIADHLDALSQCVPQVQPPTLITEIIREEDWNQRWKERFKPFSISAHLVIKPSWEEYLPNGNEKIIEMDPGMAFGTGHHASTRLALEHIDALYHGAKPVPQSVLDVGTGTGILAMACVLFGARKALAIDNDPEAVTVAGENLARNKLEALVTASGIPLAEIRQSFDLVIANIIHDTLIDLAPALHARTAPGGSLILAGILVGPQTENIRNTYTRLGLQHLDTREDGEWSSLLFAKP